MAVYTVEKIGGKWRVVRDGTAIDGEYRSRDEGTTAMQDLLRAKEKNRGKPAKLESAP